MKKLTFQNFVKELDTYVDSNNNKNGMKAFNIIVKTINGQPTLCINNPEYNYNNKLLRIIISKKKELVFNISDIEYIKIRYYNIGEKSRNTIVYEDSKQIVKSEDCKNNPKNNLVNDTITQELNKIECKEKEWICSLKNAIAYLSSKYYIIRIYMKNNDIYLYRIDSSNIEVKNDFIVLSNILKSDLTKLRNEICIFENEITRIEGALI